MAIKKVITGVGKAAESVARSGKRLVEDVFGGPGQVLGLITSAGAAAIVGPGFAIPVFLGTTTLTQAAVLHRRMTGREYEFAFKVFGASLPSPDRIILTNISGLGGRQFVVPVTNMFGQYIVCLGPNAYHNPIGFHDSSYPVAGQVFIHELTHVWQMARSSFPGYLCSALSSQIRYSLFGSDVYDRRGIGQGSSLGKNFASYGPEEQATIVDTWFALQSRAGFGGRLIQSYFLDPYIEQNIRRSNVSAPYHFEVPQIVLNWLCSSSSVWSVRYANGASNETRFQSDGTVTTKAWPNATTPGPIKILSATASSTVQKPTGGPPISRLRRAGTPNSTPTRDVTMFKRTTSFASPRELPLDNRVQGRWVFRPGRIEINWQNGSTERWEVRELVSFLSGQAMGANSGLLSIEQVPLGQTTTLTPSRGIR